MSALYTRSGIQCFCWTICSASVSVLKTWGVSGKWIKNPAGTLLQGGQERDWAAGGSESNKGGIDLPDSGEGQHDLAPVLGVLLQGVSLQIDGFQVLCSLQLIQVTPALDQIIIHLQSTHSHPHTHRHCQSKHGEQETTHSSAGKALAGH